MQSKKILEIDGWLKYNCKAYRKVGVRDVAQLGSALPWGGRGHGFKSHRSDHDSQRCLFGGVFLCGKHRPVLPLNVSRKLTNFLFCNASMLISFFVSFHF